MHELGSIATMFSPFMLAIMASGVFGGLIVGAIPGLTSTMAVALLVPITFGLPMDLSLTILVSVYIGSISGGLVAATLLNIPGTPASVTTTFDAYPMTARGEAGKALAYGVCASFFGSLIGAFVLAFAAPTLGRFALSFNAYEYFALIVFTLTCIIAISGKSLVKGLLSGLLGIFFSLVGLSATDNVARFTLGYDSLEAGFAVMPVLIGMYSISQIFDDMDNIDKPMEVAKATFTFGEFWGILVSFKNSVWNTVRSSLIGVGIGILPGIGPNVAGVMAYSQAKSASKTPDKFGTGHSEGIVASEAANNACTGGALIPLLTLGIPGDATTMMLLGAFMLHGVQPGPLLFRDHGEIFTYVLAAYVLSTMLMLVWQIVGIRVLIKALHVPRHILYPLIMTMCVLGCFSLNSNMFDVWVFLGMGLLGFILKKLDFPLLPLVLGLILGQMAENNLSGSWLIGNNSFNALFDRPVACVLLLISVFSIVVSLRMRRKGNNTTQV